MMRIRRVTIMTIAAKKTTGEPLCQHVKSSERQEIIQNFYWFAHGVNLILTDLSLKSCERFVAYFKPL